jgi:hypothetical protein
MAEMGPVFEKLHMSVMHEPMDSVQNRSFIHIHSRFLLLPLEHRASVKCFISRQFFNFVDGW